MELKETFQKVKAASKTLGLLSDEQRNEVLKAVADAIIAETPALLAANAEDLAKMDKANPLYDRLQLTEQRLQDIASDMRHVSTLPSPLGRVLKDKTLENGLHLQRVAVPFGVIGMIYEARPNVTYDVFSLCFKSGNACVLKGGKDANASNSAGVELIHKVLITFGIDPNVVTLLPATHEATGEMLNAVGYIDLCIPRGGKKLINFVRDTAKVPVIETGAGVVHCYFDKDGDLEMGKRIITNAKCRRVSVCNALDCLLIHENRLSDLPALCKGLAEKQTKIHADAKAYEALKGHYPDTLLYKAEESEAKMKEADANVKSIWNTEWLSMQMGIKTVASEDEALDGRCSLRLCECSNQFHRWRTVRIGRRNWYQYPKAWSTRTNGARRDYHLQVVDYWSGTDKSLTRPAPYLLRTLSVPSLSFCHVCKVCMQTLQTSRFKKKDSRAIYIRNNK